MSTQVIFTEPDGRRFSIVPAPIDEVIEASENLGYEHLDDYETEAVAVWQGVMDSDGKTHLITCREEK